ncbi:MAG: class I SAM-dependent methyltransferase [Planctomycetes bacterium]|nr:class I SAM-dependent methyltransferase [Planctomycetota bacterium]
MDEATCAACGRVATRVGGILDFLGDAPSSSVSAFYERRPFPGYGAGDDAAAILDRSRRSPFLAALDRAIALDARVLDAGCGTGQLAAFLALAAPQRTIVAVDACRASLREAAAFRDRTGTSNLTLARCDLFALALARAAFDVVVCRGVVHHTPDPDGAIAEVAARVAPGGVLVLGFYESVARIPHLVRRGIARLAGRPITFLDPVLHRADLDDEKKRTWIEDQYRHPLDRPLSLGRVIRVLRDRDLRWVRAVPPIRGGEPLFHETREPRRFAALARGIGWALSSGEDAGLVCVVARRQPRA